MALTELSPLCADMPLKTFHSHLIVQWENSNKKLQITCLR